MKQYTILLKKSGGQWVSLCLEMMVAGSGKTRNKAIESVKEAIECYITAMDSEGLSSDRPVPLNVLHRFLAGEEQDLSPVDEKITAEVRVLAYGTA